MYCTPFPSINPSSATYLFIVFFRSLPRAHGNRWSSFLSVTSPCPKMFILGLVRYLCRMIKVCRLAHLRTCHSLLDKTDTATPSFQNWLLSLLFFFFFLNKISPARRADALVVGKLVNYASQKLKKRKKKSNIIIYFKLDSRPWWIWSKIFLPGLFWFDLHVSMKKLHFVSLSFSNRLKY